MNNNTTRVYFPMMIIKKEMNI